MQQAGGFDQAPFGFAEVTKQRLDKPIETFAKPGKARIFRLGKIARLDQRIAVAQFFRHLRKQQSFAQSVTRDGDVFWGECDQQAAQYFARNWQKRHPIGRYMAKAAQLFGI